MDNHSMIFVTGDSLVINANFEEQSKLLEKLEKTSGYTEVSEGVFLISDSSAELIKKLQKEGTVASL